MNEFARLEQWMNSEYMNEELQFELADMLDEGKTVDQIISLFEKNTRQDM